MPIRLLSALHVWFGGLKISLLSLPRTPRILPFSNCSRFVTRATGVHRALVKAGAHFTSMGDSLAGPDVTSPKMFDRFARAYEARLVKDLAADDIFVVIHICGDTTKILKYLAGYEFCGFELDYKTDAQLAKKSWEHVTCCSGTSTLVG